MISEGEPTVGYFDRHASLLCIALTILLLLYTTGLLLIWYGFTLGADTTITYGIYLVSFPTELSILFSYASRSRGFAFQRIHVKMHSTWLLLNEIYRFVTTIDIMLAAAGALVPTLFLFSPAIKSGVFTVDKISTLWAGMAVLALFSVLYGRSLMQVLGLRYETIGGASLIGASAYASLASFKFRNEKRSGLDYLTASLAHVKSVLSARGSELNEIETTELAVRSMLDSMTTIPFETLRELADRLVKLPSLLELPADLRVFLSETKWPQEIKPVKRRVYGIEWVAATATITAAVVGFVASIVQASGKGSVTEAILSPSSAYFIVAIALFVMVFVIYLRLTQYSVQTRDIDALEEDLVVRSGALIGTRTTLRTMALIPKAFLATGSAVLVFISGFFLIGTLLVSLWYRNFLSIFPLTVYVFGLVLFVIFLLLTYVLVRDIWREFKPKGTKSDSFDSERPPS